MQEKIQLRDVDPVIESCLIGFPGSRQISILRYHKSHSTSEEVILLAEPQPFRSFRRRYPRVLPLVLTHADFVHQLLP